MTDTTQTILSVLASGGAWSNEELQAKTGLPAEKIKNAMHVLRRRGHQAIEPNRYVATDVGKAHFASTVLRELRIAEALAAKAKERQKRAAVTDEERQARALATRKRSIAAKHQKRLEARAALAKADERDFVHKRVEAPAVADSIVASAIAARPALQARWSWLEPA